MVEQDKNVPVLCDDFGLSRGVDLAIIELLKEGVCSGTSILMTSQLDLQMIEQLKDLKKNLPAIKLGIHLNFSIPDNNATTISFNRYLKSLYSQKLRKKIEKDLTKQILHFKNLFDQNPDHIDSHQHFHQLPIIRNILLKLITKNKMHHTPVRNTFIPLNFIINNYKVFSKKELCIMLWFNIIGKSLRNILIKNSFITNSNFLGFYDLTKKIDPKRKWNTYSTISNKTSLFVIHPGYEDESILNFDPINSQRFNELEAIKSMNTQFKSNKNINHANYGQGYY